MHKTYTPKQAAKEFGVAPITVYKWVEKQLIKATVIPAGERRRILISQEAIDARKADLKLKQEGGYFMNADYVNGQALAVIHAMESILGLDHRQAVRGVFGEEFFTGKRHLLSAENLDTLRFLGVIA